MESPPRSRLLEKAPERSRPRGRWNRLGDLLLLAGMLVLALAGFLYLSGSNSRSTALPPPVALAGISEDATAVALPTNAATTEAPTGEPTAYAEAGTLQPTTVAIPTETPVPTPTPMPVRAGIPIRMVISSIGVDSKVQEVGTYQVGDQLYYETIPFIIGHYKMTAKVGDKGNAVFSGHVTSRNAGNVFKDLYKVQLGDKIDIYTEESEFVYEVSRIRLVPPTEVSVMDPAPDAVVTLITCAGEWVPEKREFTQRLIVVANLKSAKVRDE